MIAYIRGTLKQIYEDVIIVDVQGIGYEVNCANPFVFQTSINEDVFIHTYHHVREDDQILYGFKNEEEKYLFTKLISVSGIGPKSGLAIQGSVDVNDFISAVEREDEKYLMSFPGIGKKTARQIILDLKGELTNLLTADMAAQVEQDDHAPAREHLNEAKEVLRSLGYQEQEIGSIAPQLSKVSSENTDELVKKALSLLVQN